VSCGVQKYVYAAVTKAVDSHKGNTTKEIDHCLCAQQVGLKDTVAHQSKCSKQCEADTKQLCGAVGFLNVFETGVAASTEVISTTELAVQHDGILLIEANGLLRTPKRAQQSMAMRFTLGNDDGPALGVYNTRGNNAGDAWGSFSTLGMRAVRQGVHELSLTANAAGGESLFDFEWKEDLICNGPMQCACVHSMHGSIRMVVW